MTPTLPVPPDLHERLVELVSQRGVGPTAKHLRISREGLWPFLADPRVRAHVSVKHLDWVRERIGEVNG